MNKFITFIRIIACICILAKGLSIGSIIVENSSSDISVGITILPAILLFSFLYLSLEFGVRFFIFPLLYGLPFSKVFLGYSHILPTLGAKEESSEEETNPLERRNVQKVLNYTLETFENVLYAQEIALLISNIKSFLLTGSYSDKTIDRNIPHLRTIDICHFAWNLATHLKISHMEMARFIKSQFSFPLRDVESGTIYKKMGTDVKNENLPRVTVDKELNPFLLAEKLGLIS